MSNSLDNMHVRDIICDYKVQIIDLISSNLDNMDLDIESVTINPKSKKIEFLNDSNNNNIELFNVDFLELKDNESVTNYVKDIITNFKIQNYDYDKISLTYHQKEIYRTLLEDIRYPIQESILEKEYIDYAKGIEEYNFNEVISTLRNYHSMDELDAYYNENETELSEEELYSFYLEESSPYPGYEDVSELENDNLEINFINEKNKQFLSQKEVSIDINPFVRGNDNDENGVHAYTIYLDNQIFYKGEIEIKDWNSNEKEFFEGEYSSYLISKVNEKLISIDFKLEKIDINELSPLTQYSIRRIYESDDLTVVYEHDEFLLDNWTEKDLELLKKDIDKYNLNECMEFDMEVFNLPKNELDAHIIYCGLLEHVELKDIDKISLDSIIKRNKSVSSEVKFSLDGLAKKQVEVDKQRSVASLDNKNLKKDNLEI